MHKPSKPKKAKVQKLTEEEYAAYIASLKEQSCSEKAKPPLEQKQAELPQN